MSILRIRWSCIGAYITPEYDGHIQHVVISIIADIHCTSSEMIWDTS